MRVLNSFRNMLSHLCIQLVTHSSHCHLEKLTSFERNKVNILFWIKILSISELSLYWLWTITITRLSIVCVIWMCLPIWLAPIKLTEWKRYLTDTHETEWREALFDWHLWDTLRWSVIWLALMRQAEWEHYLTGTGETSWVEVLFDWHSQDKLSGIVIWLVLIRQAEWK